MAKADVTAQRLREAFEYDHKTGDLRWRICPSRRVHIGEIAGSINPVWGRRQVRIDGTIYFAHRLIWRHVTGEWPANEIDHIDGNPLNNRFENLRDVTRHTNQQNIRKADPRNRSGLLGAMWHSQNKCWRARIMSHGKSVSLGCFKTPEEAHAAYVEAKRRLHEGCTI